MLSNTDLTENTGLALTHLSIHLSIYLLPESIKEWFRYKPFTNQPNSTQQTPFIHTGRATKDFMIRIRILTYKPSAKDLIIMFAHVSRSGAPLWISLSECMYVYMFVCMYVCLSVCNTFFLNPYILQLIHFTDMLMFVVCCFQFFFKSRLCSYINIGFLARYTFYRYILMKHEIFSIKKYELLVKFVFKIVFVSI